VIKGDVAGSLAWQSLNPHGSIVHLAAGTGTAQSCTSRTTTGASIAAAQDLRLSPPHYGQRPSWRLAPVPSMARAASQPAPPSCWQGWKAVCPGC
jgi:hypothetical protein